MKKLLTLMPLALLAVLPLVAGASCSSSSGQRRVQQKSSDQAVLSVTYETVCQIVEEEPRREKDLMRLDIGRHSSQFRSVIIEWIKDNGLVPGTRESQTHPFKGYTWLEYQVVKNLPKPGYQYFTHGHISTRDKTEGLFKWQLLSDDSVVCNYPCKKARTTFRGRTWTVWYAPQLAYSDGPWKFCGLPGLVLEACESEGKLAFRCKRIEANTGYGIFLVKHNANPMLNYDAADNLEVYMPSRAAELMMLERWDAIAYAEEMFGEIKASGIEGGRTMQVLKKGRPVKPMFQTAILYEKYPQIDIAKKYPPKHSK